MRRSRVLEKLRSNDWVLITSTSFTSSPCVTELAGSVGFDCLWVDMEHRAYDYNTVFGLIQGARAANTDCVIRVRKESYADYFRVLEDGAAGVMVPHCKSAEEARFIVRNCKYSPLGMRGIDGAGVDSDYGMASLAEHRSHANRETFVVTQIEDREAVDCIDEIASVEGVDVFFIGIVDLSQSYGVTGDFKHPMILEAIKKVSEASQRYEKWWGLPVRTPEEAQEYLDMGARFLSASSDRAILVNGFRKIKQDFSVLRINK